MRTTNLRGDTAAASLYDRKGSSSVTKLCNGPEGAIGEGGQPDKRKQAAV
jgi:hypothetical protein